MMGQIDRVATDTYRMYNMIPNSPISYNQFLIRDEKPALIHTGFADMYEDVRSSIAEILDPSSLQYVVILHFEADECGGMRRFVSESSGAQLVCSKLSADLNLAGWDFSGPILPVEDGSQLDLGTHTLRFLETPHVHHWDSMMVYDETTRSLYPSDLFIQPGEQPAVIERDLGEEMCQLYRGAGIFAAEEPVLNVVDRLETMDPGWIHPMHGGSLPEPLITPHVNALRNRPFAYEGTLFGRQIG